MPGSRPHSVTIETPAFSAAGRKVGDRLAVVGGDQRRTRLDGRKHGIAHQRLRQQVDDRVDAPHHLCQRGVDRPFRDNETNAAEIGQAGEPRRAVRLGVDAHHFVEPAGDEIGDRRPPLQAETSENRDLHAGSLRAGGSALSDQHPSGKLTHLLHEAMTTKVSLRVISPTSPTPGISSLVMR